MNATTKTSASHCRRDGRVLKIFDWPATRSVYVAIRGEVKRKINAAPRRLSLRSVTYQLLRCRSLLFVRLNFPAPQNVRTGDTNNSTRGPAGSDPKPVRRGAVRRLAISDVAVPRRFSVRRLRPWRRGLRASRAGVRRRAARASSPARAPRRAAAATRP
jgi:hypothetical protein